MRKADVDYLLRRMLESYDNVSDLNFSVAKPPQVEVSGELTPVAIDPRLERLTPFQTDTLALHLMQCDRRLSQLLLVQGSCDTSYALIGKTRFRINVFQQRNSYSTEADSAVIQTGGMRAKMPGGIDLAATASSQDHTRWRRAGYLQLRLDLLLTRLTIGPASEACKRLGFTRWSGRFAHRWSGVAAAPKPTEQETQEDEEHTHEQIETQVGWHDQPLYSGGQ